jgi:hypothetical protein
MTIHRRTLLKGLAVFPAALGAGAVLGAEPALADFAELTASDFKLKYRTTTTTGTAASYSTVIDDIHTAGALSWASVDDVLNAANRTGVGHTLGYTGFTQGWMWGGTASDPEDDQTTQWYPQGLTTSADYHDDGLYNGRHVTLVSWYDNLDDATSKGARISFVDMTDPDQPKYRHVLLVEPYLDPSTGGAGTPNFKAVKFHAGGIMWYGDLLYVVDTGKGIRIFDTRKMLKVSTSGAATAIGRQSDGSYAAFDYTYVLPQSAAYDAQATPEGVKAVVWSFISLDRSTAPDSIVVGEYGAPDDPADQKRLFRWKLDATTRLLTATSNVATAYYAVQIDVNEMNGATSVDDKYYIARANGNSPGNLVTWEPGSFVKYNDEPPHAEDLSYDKNTGWLWNLTEPIGDRYVFARDITKLQ